MISALQTRQLFKKGCEGYLAIILDTQQKEPCIEDVPIVNKFSSVFPNELPGIPLDREVELSIDFILGTSPISKAPYQMAPAKLR